VLSGSSCCFRDGEFKPKDDLPMVDNVWRPTLSVLDGSVDDLRFTKHGANLCCGVSAPVTEPGTSVTEELNPRVGSVLRRPAFVGARAVALVTNPETSVIERQ